MRGRAGSAAAPAAKRRILRRGKLMGGITVLCIVGMLSTGLRNRYRTARPNVPGLPGQLGQRGVARLQRPGILFPTPLVRGPGTIGQSAGYRPRGIAAAAHWGGGTMKYRPLLLSPL